MILKYRRFEYIVFFLCSESLIIICLIGNSPNSGEDWVFDHLAEIYNFNFQWINQ
jgi:hypothetical protein